MGIKEIRRGVYNEKVITPEGADGIHFPFDEGRHYRDRKDRGNVTK